MQHSILLIIPVLFISAMVIMGNVMERLDDGKVAKNTASELIENEVQLKQSAPIKFQKPQVACD